MELWTWAPRLLFCETALVQQDRDKMPLDDHARPSSGLISGVFDFVSRELESFVVNAGFVSTSREVCTKPFVVGIV